jgi:hypothetical protein
MMISISVFAFMAAIFGSLLVKTIGAGILILIGVIILIRALVKKEPVD